MRRFSIKKSLILLNVLIIGITLMACSNSSSDSSSQEPAITSVDVIQQVTTSGTVSEAKTTDTGKTIAVLTTSEGGAYVFTQNATSSNQNNLLKTERTAAGSGTWKYRDVEGKVKYQGTYIGDISKLGKNSLKLDLKVEKAANDDGSLETLAEESRKTFELSATQDNFEATIPEITITEASREEKLVILNVLGYSEKEGGNAQTFKRLCDEFMAENPDVTVNFDLYVDEAYHQAVASRLASGNVPDIAYMGADARWGSKWQEAGQQIDNTPFYPSNIDASLVPDFFGNGVKPYLPIGGSNYCSVVAVNMELLNEIGGELPQTYDEMKALVTKCNAKGIKLLSTHGSEDWVWGSCVMSGIIPRTTGDLKWIEKAVNKQVKFTDQGFKNALSVLSTWVTDGILDPESVNTDSGTGMANFVKGDYLMYIDGQWAFGQANLGELSKTVKLIPIPPVPNELSACANSMAGAWQVGYGITKKGASDAKVLDAAKKWLAYFNSTKETVQRLKDGGISAPIIKDFVLPEGMDPCISEKAKLGTYPSCYVIDSYLTGTANDILNAGMKDIVSEKTTAEELAAKVQTAFDAQ